MKKFTIFLLLTVLTTTGAGCFGGSAETVAMENAELAIWRVFDNDDTFQEIIDSYRAIHPNLKITYKKLRFDEYEKELLEAFARGEGPDILSLHNTWLPAYQDLLEPMPSSVTVNEYQTVGTLRKETLAVNVEKKTMSMATLKSDFVDQVAEDVVLDYRATQDSDPEEKIYGLPLSLDSLALFYNKDLFNAAGVATVPTTWEEFQNAVELLTAYDKNGNISQSGAALGTSGNVERAADIVSLLMMQNGTEMTDERGRITFAAIPEDSAEDVYPGYDAVSFYTDFANPTKKVYTWNEDFSGSFEAFTNGQTALFLGYSYHIPLLRTAAPKLNFGVAQVPQIDPAVRKVNFANYWVEAVADSSEFKDWAWDFVLFAADEDNVGSYLEEAQKPTALRGLIATQLDSELLGPFAQQALTAKSWYHGYDAPAAEQAFADLIDLILAGTDEPDNALSNAAKRVAQTYTK